MHFGVNLCQYRRCTRVRYVKSSCEVLRGIADDLNEDLPMLTSERSATASVLGALLAAGFAAGVAQVLLMRELLVVADGNELSMGLLLACWLLAGALGSLLARRLTGSGDDPRGPALRLAMLCALPAPLLMISVAIARATPFALSSLGGLSAAQAPAVGPVLSWLAIRPGEMLGLGQMALVGALVAFGPAALDGAQFAIGCDLYCQARGTERVGAPYAADAIGHLVGGVLLATAVVLLLDPFTMALAVAAVNAVAALALGAAFLGIRPPRLARLGATALIGLVTASLLTGRLDALSLWWRWHNHDLIASIESIYGNTAIVVQEPDGIYLYQNGVYTGASPPLVGTIDELVHFTMLQHPQPEAVLLIGGGITGGLREVLKHEPSRVDYIELDGTLFELAERWAAPGDRAALKDPRVNLMAGDGRRCVAQAARCGRIWDVVLVVLPDPSTAQLNRFYTRGFYEELAEVLGPGGVVGWQVPGSSGYFSPSLLRLHRSLVGTAGLALGKPVRMPGESTVCVAGPAAELTDDWVELHRRLRRRGIEARYFEVMLSDRLRPDRLQAVASALHSAEPPETNTDLRPIGYFLDQTWWLTQLHPASARLLGRLSRLRLGDALIPLAPALVVLLAPGWLRAVRTAWIPLGLATSGFASMSLELALLFAFQAFYGYVYHMVGVIIGAFMVGVACGSIAADRWLRGRDAQAAGRALPIGLAFMAVASLALGLGLLGMVRATVSGALVALFPLVTALIGLAVGVVFPLAAKAWGGERTARAAAGLYAADLIGAAAGAVLAGAFFAPVLGLTGTCWLAAAIVGAAALLLGVRALAGD